MKRNLYILLSICMAALLTACNDMNDVGEAVKKTESIKLLLSVQGDKENPLTRAGTEPGSEIENKITSLDILFYEATFPNAFLYRQRIVLTPGSNPEGSPNWVVTDSKTGTKTITIPLNSSWFDINKPMHLFVYANVPEEKISESSPLGQSGYSYNVLTAKNSDFDFITDIIENGTVKIDADTSIPMEGYKQNVQFDLSNLSVNIPLRRILAKVRYKITFEDNVSTRNFDHTKVKIQMDRCADFSYYTAVEEFDNYPSYNAKKMDVITNPKFNNGYYSNECYLYKMNRTVDLMIQVPYKGKVQTFTIPIGAIDRNHIYDVNVTIKGPGGVGEDLGVEINVLPWTVHPYNPDGDDAVGTYKFIPHYEPFYLNSGSCFFDFIYFGSASDTYKVEFQSYPAIFYPYRQTGTLSDNGSYTRIYGPYQGTGSINTRFKIELPSIDPAVRRNYSETLGTYKISINGRLVEEHTVEFRPI